MQCLDDHLDYPSASATVEVSSAPLAGEWQVVNKVANRSTSQLEHAPKGKAMSCHPSATHRRLLHRSAAGSLLLFFFLAIASAESAALHHTSKVSEMPESDDVRTSPSSLESLLALNSSASAHCTKEHLHRLLAPLTDETAEDEAAFESAHKTEANFAEAALLQHSRTKREVSPALTPFENGDVSLSKPQKNKNRPCYKKALRRCGRTFVNSYKFVRVKKNKDNDILVAQCALRTAFFDCLKGKTADCKKETPPVNEITGRVKKHSKRRADSEEVPSTINTTASKRKDKNDAHLRNRLAETIWDSRVCIFKESLRMTP